MERIAVNWGMSGLLLVLLLLYSYASFDVIGQLLGVTKGKKIQIILLGFVNTGLVFVLSFAENSDARVAYVAIFVLWMTEIWLLYRTDLRRCLFLAITFMLHIMVFHTITNAAMAWTHDISMYEVANNYDYLFTSVGITMALLIGGTLMVRFLLPLAKVRIVLQNANQRMFQTIWMSICVLYLLYNAQVYQQGVTLGNFYFDQILKCATMLLGGYVMLFYNFRVSTLLGYKEKNEDLTTQLNTNAGFLEAITGSARRRYEVNVSQDTYRFGLPDESSFAADEEEMSYSKEFPMVARSLLVPEDLPALLKVMDRENLLAAFERGETKLTMDYRVGKTAEDGQWHRMILSLIEEEETGDVLALAYTMDVQEEYEEKQQLYAQARQDMMTGVYNRDTFEGLVTEELRTGRGVLLMADIDNFKAVNDQLGHDRGDEILKRMAQLLQQGFRANDIVGRFGGDEFMVYVKNSPMTDHILRQVERIQKEAEAVLETPKGKSVRYSLSIGIVEIPTPGMPFSVAYKQVDTALYRAKERGKNMYCIYQGEDACPLDGACPEAGE